MLVRGGGQRAVSIVFATYQAPAAAGNERAPAVRGLATGAALGNAAYGAVPTVLGSAQNVIIGTVASPGDQRLGWLPTVHGIAVSTAGTFGMAGVPTLTAAAAQGVAGSGEVAVRALASAISGVLGLGAAPLVAGAATALPGLQPAVSLANAALPLVMGSGTGTAFYPAHQSAPAPPVGALAVEAPGGTMAGTVPLVRAIASSYPSLRNFAFLVQSAGYMAATTSDTTLTHLLGDQWMAQDNVWPDAVHALLDLFQLSDTYAHAAQVLQALKDGLTLADVASMLWQADLLDSFLASAVPAGMAQVTVLLRDAWTHDDSAGALSEILAAIAEGFHVSLTLRNGDDTYTAWVMTPENRAMRSYSSWPFNSIATIGGQLFGAADDGLYLLGGDTDAGQAILASIRTGRLSLGNTRLKRIDRAYIGANTAGNLLLKVEATTIAGDRLQQVYRMTPAVTDEPREHRVDVGRGFRSVYWTFELANDTDGADFELHDMQVLPLTLSGRTF